MPELGEHQVTHLNYEYCPNCQQNFKVGDDLVAVVVATEMYGTSIRFCHTMCHAPEAPEPTTPSVTRVRPR